MRRFSELPSLILFREINGRIYGQDIDIDWEPDDDRGPSVVLDPDDRYLMLSVTGTILLRHEDGKIRMRQLRVHTDENGAVHCPICERSPRIAAERENKSTLYYCKYCDSILPGDYEEPDSEEYESGLSEQSDSFPIPPF